MYHSFYNLRENPFGIDTNPKFLWLGEKHQEALATLKFGLIEGNGYVVMTGDVGTGKTTIVKALIDTLDDHILVSTINHPTLNNLEFFNLVARSYDLSAEITNKSDFLSLFTAFLKTSKDEGKVVLLVIDEAHRLSKELLEEIRLLSNIEQTGTSLINIFFVGQNELKQLLFTPECRAIRQRITLFYEIEPLLGDEVRLYIDHRLRIAGRETNMFTLGALHEILRFTQGYPRLINTLCNHALLTGFIREQNEIDKNIILECKNHIKFLDPKATTTVVHRRQNPSGQGKHLIQKSPNKEKKSENQKSQGNKVSYMWWLIGATGILALVAIGVGITNHLRLLDKDNASISFNDTETTKEALEPVDQNKGALQPPSKEIESSRETQTSRNQAELLERGRSDNTDSTSIELPAKEDLPPLATPSSAPPASPEISTSPSTSVASVSSEAKEPVQNKLVMQPPLKEVESTPQTETDKNPAEIPEREEPGNSEITSIELSSKNDLQPLQSRSSESSVSTEKSNTQPAAMASVSDKALPQVVQQTQTRESASKEIEPDQTLKPSQTQAETTERGESDVSKDTKSSLALATEAVEQDNFQFAIDLLEDEEVASNESFTESREIYVQALVGRAEQILISSPDESEKLLLKAIEIDPNNISSHLNLGKIYLSTQKYTSAIEAYQHAVELDPKLSNAYFNLGFIYATTGDYAEAEKRFARVVELKPNYLDKALFNLALVQEKLEKTDECVENLRLALRINPDNMKVQRYLELLIGNLEG